MEDSEESEQPSEGSDTLSYRWGNSLQTLMHVNRVAIDILSKMIDTISLADTISSQEVDDSQYKKSIRHLRHLRYRLSHEEPPADRFDDFRVCLGTYKEELGESVRDVLTTGSDYLDAKFKKNEQVLPHLASRFHRLQ